MVFEDEPHWRVDAEGFVDDCRAITRRMLEGAGILKRGTIAKAHRYGRLAACTYVAVEDSTPSTSACRIS